ncbi:MAG: hypothetical protein WD768_14475 [Phycisphaeraceae bacterium]
MDDITELSAESSSSILVGERAEDDAVAIGRVVPRASGEEAGENSGGGGGGAGGCLSNTPPTNGQDRYSGTDTLHVSYCIEWGPEFAEISDQLEAAKKASAERGDVEDQQIKLGGYVYTVGSRGVGGEDGAPYMAYVLRSGGVALLLSRKDKPSGQTPNVRIEFGALACLAAGALDDLAASVRARVSSFGVIKRECVGRVDFFVDLAGVPVAPFVNAFRENRVITRARKNAEYGVYCDGHNSTGFTIGTDTRLRVYDKVAELEKNRTKFAAWVDLEWDGKEPDECTRVEFQLRRNALKAYKITTLDELVAAAGGITADLGEGWFRLTTHAVDRRNQKRAQTSEIWTWVQAGYRQVYGEGRRRRVMDRKRADVDALVRQGMGCFESALAIMGGSAEGTDELVARLQAKLDEVAAKREERSGDDVYTSVARKRKAFESAYPVEPAMHARFRQSYKGVDSRTHDVYPIHRSVNHYTRGHHEQTRR